MLFFCPAENMLTSHLAFLFAFLFLPRHCDARTLYLLDISTIMISSHHKYHSSPKSPDSLEAVRPQDCEAGSVHATCSKYHAGTKHLAGQHSLSPIYYIPASWAGGELCVHPSSSDQIN